MIVSLRIRISVRVTIPVGLLPGVGVPPVKLCNRLFNAPVKLCNWLFNTLFPWNVFRDKSKITLCGSDSDDVFCLDDVGVWKAELEPVLDGGPVGLKLLLP